MSRARRGAALLLLLGACREAPPEAPAQAAAEPTRFAIDPAGVVRHRLAFPAPATHLIEVESTFPASGPSLPLMMAVWTPGSYLVREYARHLEGLTASDPEGRPLEVTKVRKNRFEVQTGGARAVRVRYRVYARLATVQAAFVDADHAVINGAAVFLAEVGALDRPHAVQLELPPGWQRCVTALEPDAGAGPERYLAPSFDALLDAPILCGSPAVHELEVRGVPHLLANEGEGGVFDGAKAASDVGRLLETIIDFWGGVPYDRFAILNVLNEGRGGLEHGASTLLMTSRWVTKSEERYKDWLSLVSHEVFHAWNGKRLRPVELGPFDYEEEVYTRGLWVVEGLTSYYDDLLVARAGLMDEKAYLAALSKSIQRLETTPGRRFQPLEEASFDAWIKFYRPDEFSANGTVSYYVKGAVVGFLLDQRIRAASREARSLDDVMRLAFARYSGERGYTREELLDVVREVGGAEVASWLSVAVSGTRELDYGEALAWYGLRFAEAPAKKGGWLGVEIQRSDGRAMVTRVVRDSPAAGAGLMVDDELVAIDGYRLDGEPAARLEHYAPEQVVQLLIARRQVMRTLEATLGERPRESFTLERVPGASREQVRRRGAWLSSR